MSPKTTTTKKRTRRRSRAVLLALLGGLLTTGVVGASATTLGGTGDGPPVGLGSEDADIGSCDSDGVILSYTYVYSATAKHYNVTGIKVSDVAADCAGKAASASLRKGIDPLSSGVVESVALTDSSFTIAVSPVQASLVDGVSLVISG